MIEKKISEWINKTDFNVVASSWLELFADNVRQSPDRAAVYFNNQKLSYRQLDELSNWYAAKVEGLATKKRFIGLCTERSSEMLAAMIGIQKAGKAYLPIDSGFPQKRISHMINDSGVEVIITDNIELLSTVSDTLKFIKISDAEMLADYKAEKSESNDFAYVLYTSGSTGLPKGVVVQHGAFLNFLLSMKEKPGCTENDIVLALTTISFDISGLELFLPLITKAAVWVAASDAVYDPESIVKLISEKDITIAQTTASVWKLILDLGFKGKDNLKILCGGEFFSGDLAKRLFATGCEVWNMYGPTETTIWSSVFKIDVEPVDAPPIGLPIANTGFHILDNNKIPVEEGVPGNLWISGKGLALGYWNNEKLTKKVFQDFMYNTGDSVYELSDGNIAFIGRTDTQVKVRGMRIEAGEIESVLLQHPDLKDAVVLVREDDSGNQFLAAFFILQDESAEPEAVEIRKFLKGLLPDYMIPTTYYKMGSFPMTLNNKIDRKAFPEITVAPILDDSVPKKSASLEEVITKLWSKALNHSNFDNDDNFFDVGGHSFLLIQITKELSDFVGEKISPMLFFENPTINQLRKALGEPVLESNSNDTFAGSEQNEPEVDELAVAIIGMSCAVPGAANIDEFWDLLKNGKSGIRDYTDSELRSEGISEEQINNLNYVKRSGYLESSRYFDNEFFGYSPKEAKFMDPQHRLMLEHSYKALESAGIDPFDYEGRIGVFAGSSRNKYLMRNILFSSAKDNWPDFQTMIGNDNDFLASRVAYKLNLRGPALTIQTACSTSLVAVQTAYQSLLNYQCDAAICGGVSVNVPEKEGYEYNEGAIFSKDGVCRAFDKNANGTIFGSGVGVVLLKRLVDALKDGDPIVAVIRGAAINNDGSGKIGYTAPSVTGQAEVIRDALELADIPSNTVSYIEAHGTGTILGDPIELEGLKKAFGNNGKGDDVCYLGSVKTNIGHLDAAAGVSGLIKTALSLQHKQLPPSLNYNIPNPELKIEETRFEVNAELREWAPVNGRRVAGVSAFGIGGTNAHVILESFENDISEPETSSTHIIYPLSAKSKESQAEYQKSVVDFIKNSVKSTKLNTAHTLLHGRHDYDYRGFFVQNINEVESESVIVNASKPKLKNPEAVLVFPGQGTQYPGMSRTLYENNAVYKKHLDQCFLIIDEATGWDSKKILFEKDDWRFKTEFTQPLLFSVEYSIGKTLIEYGLECNILTGHSLGEFPAACIAEAFSLEDGIKLVINRGRIMAKAENGAMLAVFSAFEEIKDKITKDVDIAGINADNQVVFSGSLESINYQQKKFEDNNIVCKRISESSAFHSRLMDSILDEFSESLTEIKFNPITKTVISNLHGTLLAPGFIYSVDYWVKQLRNTVKFYKGISELKDIADLVFVEAGPGAVLSKLLRAIHGRSDKAMIQTIPSFGSDADDLEFFFKAIGNLWKTGLTVDLAGLNDIQGGRRIQTPVYAFTKNEHWVFPDKVYNAGGAGPIEQSMNCDNEKHKKETITDSLKLIWSELLGYDDVDLDQNFFDLGGDSLSSSLLVNRINKTFALKLRIKDVIVNPVFSEMETVIKKNLVNFKDEIIFSDFIDKYLIELNKSSSENLIYFIVGVQLYQKLAEQLSAHAKCYGIYLPEEEALLNNELEKEEWEACNLAESYKKVILLHSNGRPVTIIGVSFGGLVGYEVSKQLSSEGVNVKLLVMLDSLLPTGIKKNTKKWIMAKAIEIIRFGCRPMMKKIKRKLKSKYRSDKNDKNTIFERRGDAYSRAVNLFVQKEEGFYAGDVLLLKAEDATRPPGYEIDREYGWGKYLKKPLLIESSPGDHLGILKEPNVNMTASKIYKHLK